GGMADTTERKRTERTALAERRVFEQITRNAPLPEVLASITQFVESAGVGAASSVSVLADHRQLFAYMVAPQMPQVLRSALEHARVHIRNGSCAAAVYLDRPVLVSGIAPHSLSPH